MAAPTALFRTSIVALCAAVLAFAPTRSEPASAGATAVPSVNTDSDAMPRFVPLD
jgi:hypothetical protein